MKRLPSDMFLLIRNYLSDYDYLSLMNCNHSMFSLMKYETVYFRFSNNGIEWTSNDMSSIMNIIQRVKDKRKQIHMKLSQVSLSQVMEYSQLFEGIHRVSIILLQQPSMNETTDDDNNNSNNILNFNIFNNIYQVELSRFCNITIINDGFHNVNTLIIENWRDLREIYNINNNRSLRKISIMRCEFIPEYYFNVEEVESVELQSCRLRGITTSSLNRLKYLSIISQETITHELMETIYQSAPFLHSLTLECKLLPLDFTALKDIPHLTLFSRNTSQYVYPIPLKNEVLYLTSFDLTAWNKTLYTFDSIRTLYLKGIIGLVDFPIMSNLRELSLYKCNSLRSIPSLEKLFHLIIRICPRLTSVAELQPSLRIVKLQRVPIKNFAFISSNSNHNIKEVAFTRCLISNLSEFVKIPKLSIGYCPTITSLAGLAGKSLEEDRRIIKLIELNNITDFSVLYNIYDLTFIGMKGLTNGEGIHNIHHLSFCHCSNLISTSGLSRITSSLSLTQCSNLTHLINIHGIPKVVVDDIDFDINVLFSSTTTFKNHDEVNIIIFHSSGNDKNIMEQKGKRLVSFFKPIQRELNIQKLMIKCNNKKEISFLE